MYPISITPCPSLDRDEPIGKTSHDSVQQQSKLCLHQYFSNPHPSPCTSFPSRHAFRQTGTTPFGKTSHDSVQLQSKVRLHPLSFNHILHHESLFLHATPSTLNQTGTTPIGNKSHDSVWSQSYLHLHLRPFSFNPHPSSWFPFPSRHTLKPTGTDRLGINPTHMYGFLKLEALTPMGYSTPTPLARLAFKILTHIIKQLTLKRGQLESKSTLAL